MYGAILIPASIGLCWMFSPDALVLLTNGFGRGSLLFIVPLAIVVLIATLAINLLHHPSLSIVDTSIDTLSGGTHLAIVSLSLASYFSLVLLLPTGMLVSAGFTFNETFVYWFPNFGFSFLLLGLILLLHLADERFALALQPLFIGTTVACVLILSLAGLLPPTETGSAPPAQQQISVTLSLLLSPFLLVLGYDRQEAAATRDNRPIFRLTIAVYFLLASLWGYAAISHVSLERLAHSSVPHILTARELLGQPGRIILGIAIISGTCGVVNGLFLLCTKVARQLFGPLLNGPSSRKRWQRKILPLVFSAIIATFMATGLAGSPELETFIYGALLLWIVTLGMRCLVADQKLRRTTDTFPRYYSFLSVVFCVAALSLATVHPDGDRLFTFCFLVLGASFAGSYILIRLARKTFLKKNLN
ncbi:MAG: hypothetical protein ACN4GW_04325 [Desulforhopalus sp.]